MYVYKGEIYVCKATLQGDIYVYKVICMYTRRYLCVEGEICMYSRRFLCVQDDIGVWTLGSVSRSIGASWC